MTINIPNREVFIREIEYTKYDEPRVAAIVRTFESVISS